MEQAVVEDFLRKDMSRFTRSFAQSLVSTLIDSRHAWLTSTATVGLDLGMPHLALDCLVFVVPFAFVSPIRMK